MSSLSERLSVLLVAAFVGAFTAGCGDDDTPPPPPPPRDGGPRDTGGDVGDVDAAEVDADLPDAPDGPDATTRDAGRDAALRDADIMRADRPPIGGCFGPGDVYDLCLCEVPPCDPADASSCEPGLRCVADGCGRNTCQPGGHRCVDEADCPAGSTCLDTRGWDDEPHAVCYRGADCADSRDCAYGYTCTGGACVARRIPCERNTDCGYGFYCNAFDTYARPYCARIGRRCDSLFGSCPVFLRCVDIDGDGLSECAFGGTGLHCDDTEDCPPSTICGWDPESGERGDMVCGLHGNCRGGDCSAGFACEDSWGDGVTECVPTAGTCRRTEDCPAPQICAPRTLDGPMECIGG